jgi:FdhD protein
MPPLPLTRSSPPEDSSLATSRAVTGALARDAGERVTWQVPEEVPVAIMYNSRSYAVMMATPADLTDLGVGFTLSEGFVDAAGQIRGVIAMAVENGHCVDVSVDEQLLKMRKPPDRALEGRTGCGLCGIEDIAQVIRPLPKVARQAAIAGEAILRAFADLPAHQPMNSLTRSVHAAAWCDPSGHVLMVREDVGRHNALDKLVGALARQDANFGSGFIAMTSRCSFELVQKAATMGVPLLATLSAPTALALDLAKRAGMTLAARSPDGIVFFGGDGESANGSA